MTRQTFPAHRGITSRVVMAADRVAPLAEMLLGMAAGGCSPHWGIKPEVCHLNEGHAAFAVLERARSFMEENAQPF